METNAPLAQAKLVLLGDMGAGKSSLVLRFVKGQFFDYQESTIGAAFLTKTMPEHGIKFEIWDTAGQERYRSLSPMYYRGASAAVIVYDITSSESFKKAQDWVKELQRQGTPNMVISLVGNKADLESARQVTQDEAKSYAEENGLFFWETSAKSNSHVSELFQDMAKRLPKAASAAPAQAQDGNIQLDQPSERPKRNGCCS
eukprot:jgi/Astpho2/6442/Aster-08287